MRLVYVSFVLVSVLVFLCQICEAIRPIIRLRPKIVLGKGYDTEDDSLKIYRTIAKTVISGYLFGALRRPFGFISHHGGWDGASPLSVTFAVGGKRPYNSDSSSDSDKSPKVEKIKIIEKEKEKPVKHIVISHKILGPPASSMSVTGGHLMPGMLEESAMAVMGSEMASPWSETQRQYSTLDSTEDSNYYGIPSALDTRRKVKIVKIKETSSSDSDDEDEYIEEDEGDSNGDYKVIKRKVYTYKDKSIEEPKTSKYGYNPNYSGEQVVAESTQAHVIRIDNGTEINYAVTPEPMTKIPTVTAIATFDPITDAPIKQTSSPDNSSVTMNHSLATSKPDQLTTSKSDLNVTKTYKIESSNIVKSKSKNQTKNANKSNKTTKESIIIADDPWLDYLNQKELQESQSISSKQSAKMMVEPVAERKKNSRKNGNRRRKSKKSKSRSRSRDNLNLDSDRLESRSWDEKSSIANNKINSVKAFGDGWVSRRRNKSKSKSRRRSSSDRSNKSKAKYRIIRMPSLSSTQNLPFNQMVALPSTSLTSLPSTGPIVFPTSIKRSLLESSLLSSNPILIPSPMLSNSMLHRRSFRS